MAYTGAMFNTRSCGTWRVCGARRRRVTTHPRWCDATQTLPSPAAALVHLALEQRKQMLPVWRGCTS